MVKQSRPAQEDIRRISFRLLDAEAATELSRRAQAVGKSRHDLARDLVTAGLSADDHPTEHLESNRLMEEMGQLRTELRKTRDLPSEAVRDVAEEIDQGLGAEIRELRTDLVKLTAELAQVGNEAGVEQVLDQLEELKVGLKGLRAVGKLVRLLRSDFLTSTNILLVHAGKLTRDEARNWTENTLRRE